MQLRSSVFFLAVAAFAGCGDNADHPIPITGAVSGLAGTGLVIANHGQELAIDRNGRFELPTPLHYGDAYDITIVQQPTEPTQTCTIANGSGKADVDGIDVRITCETGVFLVGGTVSGLAGSGLVVQNNGTDDLAIAEDGTFTFARPIASGAAFAVTVKTQPTGPSQTCTVAGGSGTIGAGPVTTVMIDCAVDRFAVGGIVAGLAGTLVLQNNGGDDITVTANGSFAFPTTVASGDAYAVTVLAQPASPSQTCTVTAGSGTVAAGDISSVRVDCTTNTYDVGGSVSGLAGTGLVLRNNGGDDLSIAADGTFTFATEVASGQPYAVMVLAQPANPTQVCTVTGGDGTVGGAAITNVSVTCVTSEFTIGGTVSGLLGSGLVLRNNGGDDLAVAADGTFAFATAVESGQSYAVTIAAQPANPTQTCTVSGGGGTVGGGDVTSVTVDCTTNKYTIGGTVSGLAGTLVLRNNGGDNLTLTANGSFAFATPIASGASYEVTVLTQPGSPSQTCVVAGGTGGVTNADITSVAVTCTTNEYSIGGTVAGLAGSGLVLRDNGGDDLAIGADGAFTFATKVASGQPYAVTVAAQPASPSQTCVVANASGIVVGANVTDVTVTCTTNTYAIGGTVTGLAGGGLVLRNNGGDDLAVSANGTFELATEVASGGSYAVTVHAQPTSPWQTCVVGSGSGVVTNAEITSVTVTCTTNTYAVGGTVTGLAGSGLVLQQSGGDDLAIGADGSFAFATKVASGQSYAVTVRTQPSSPAQTCTIAGDTGTVGGADVTSVTVNCTTNRYTIGGSVSGLAGGGLVLQQSGGDDLAISANGTFAFATTVASGDAYAVTVLAQPASPWQTCTVANASGTVGSSAVTSVDITCTTNTYTIGGSVSGLAAGNTVVLRNNGADDLSVTANGSFTFSVPVASGAMYSVAVQTNPTAPISQTCTVAGGADTVANANVTSVAVTCTTNTFTVGGTVTGLTGTGLVLRNNGGDDLTRDADGAFTFATAVASGNAYSVTVATQPSTEVCSVTSGSGTIGNANVTDVVVTCVPPVFTFTTAGATGRFGPSQAQLDTTYAGTSLAGAVTSNGGIQEWVVPASGTYRIEAAGAAGGDNFGGFGRGARMRGDVTLTAGQTLRILVGQRGSGIGSGAGGGGGTFVVLAPSSPLVVAGGGGGGLTTAISDASITTSGKTGDGANPGPGGIDGNGGSGAVSTGPGGGGGFFTNGTPGDYNGQPGFAFANGGNGGHDQNGGETSAGGFGGGGGAGAGGHSAGAGGYSGGGASGNGGSGTSGGGGSFNAGANQVNTAGANSGAGTVTITRL